MLYDFSKIEFFPVLLATLISFGVEVLWKFFYKKRKKESVTIFIIRFFALFVWACGINLLSFSDGAMVNLKQSILTCLLFVAPCLSLQHLEGNKPFGSWFTNLIYYIFHYGLLASVILVLVKLMKS